MLITKVSPEDDGGGTFLLPKGKYSFEVAAAEQRDSKSSGQPMIALTLHVYDGKGGAKVFVYDYLPSTFMRKCVEFCLCVGLTDLAEGGDLTAVRCVQRTGVVHLIQEEFNGKTSNKVDRYDFETPQKVPDGDDIPF